MDYTNDVFTCELHGSSISATGYSWLLQIYCSDMMALSYLGSEYQSLYLAFGKEAKKSVSNYSFKIHIQTTVSVSVSHHVITYLCSCVCLWQSAKTFY